MEREPVTDMSNEQLLNLFENVVRAWHYDPVGAFEEYEKYEINDLQNVIISRMKGVPACFKCHALELEVAQLKSQYRNCIAIECADFDGEKCTKKHDPYLCLKINGID